MTVQVEVRKDVELDFTRNISNNKFSNYNGTDKQDEKSGEKGKRYVTEEELDKYRYYHEYHYKRKLTKEIIDLFDVGYDSTTDCITMPIKDINGNCLFVARRSVKTKYFSYPKGTQKYLYGLYQLYQLDKFPKEVIVCESMLDALYFWTINKYAVALNGTGDEHSIKQINEMPCRKIILCTDMDTAGLKARQKLRKCIKNKLITEYILPDGRKDANECTIDELKSLQEVF
jgi:5S rRNA maturation endonuclease (ribonuclease M5)